VPRLEGFETWRRLIRRSSWFCPKKCPDLRGLRPHMFLHNKLLFCPKKCPDLRGLRRAVPEATACTRSMSEEVPRLEGFETCVRAWLDFLSRQPSEEVPRLEGFETNSCIYDMRIRADVRRSAPT